VPVLLSDKTADPTCPGATEKLRAPGNGVIWDEVAGGGGLVDGGGGGGVVDGGGGGGVVDGGGGLVEGGGGGVVDGGGGGDVVPLAVTVTDTGMIRL
jgi:hypothetical protein